MKWQIGLAALLLLWSGAAAARHGSGFLEPRRATPGIQLELIEESPEAPGGVRKYRLRAEGVPRDLKFGIWTKDFGQQFTEAYSGFQVDAAGELVSVDDTGQSRRLRDVSLDPGPYPSGAVWMVALASDDHQISAFAKVIPHPIVAKDGACKLTLELISLHGNRFVAYGEGFAVNEEVDIELRSADRVVQKAQRASAEGVLPMDVISHGGVGTDQRASYRIKGRLCGPEVKYEWGEAALIRH
jgi:hypothetical protein